MGLFPLRKLFTHVCKCGDLCSNFNNSLSVGMSECNLYRCRCVAQAHVLTFWEFFLKINKRAGQNKTAVQEKIDVQGGKFSQNQ